jgi:DNA-3-methyladenine glycosylase II
MKARQPETGDAIMPSPGVVAVPAAVLVDYAAEAVAHLRRSDPVMASIIDRVGPLKINYRRERFPALVRAIIFQQLAGRAAQAIYDRFVRDIGKGHFPSPETVLAALDEEMRKVGLSRGKMAYIRDLASNVQQRSLNFKRFPKMDDDEVIAHLTRVKGIGRWTAEMFMMFNLRRPDILPVDDLGVRMAVMKAYGMAEAPLPKQLREFGERWKPHRTAASWYLWQSMRLTTMISEAEGKPDTAAKAQADKVAAKKPKVRTKAKVKLETARKADGQSPKAGANPAARRKPAKAGGTAKS